MTLIDTHAHLYWDSFKPDFDQVIQRALDAGITTIFNVGVDVEKSRQTLDQITNNLTMKQFSDSISFYSTIGIHPHEAYKYSGKEQETRYKLQKDMETLEEIYRSNPKKVIGVGECGLDFFFKNNSDFYNPNNLSEEVLKDLQRKLLQSQIDLAKKLDLPIILHIRDDRSSDPNNSECWKEALDMISGYKGILHCYSGLINTTKRITNNELTNFLVSFAANITYPKNQYLREAAEFLPLEKICLETDSPFLAPQSKRGQRNEPEAVLESAKLIAEIKGVSHGEVANQTTQNVVKLFGLQK